MKKTCPKFLSALFAGLFFVFSSISHAESIQEADSADYYEPANSSESYSNGNEHKSYGAIIGMKTVSGFTNIVTSWLEIPKNIINTTNDTNIFWGFFGGTIKGVVVTAGRIGVGVADVITFPIPTKPIAHPNFIWQDFDIDTSFGPVFRLYNDESSHRTHNYRSSGRSM